MELVFLTNTSDILTEFTAFEWFWLEMYQTPLNFDSEKLFGLQSSLFGSNRFDWKNISKELSRKHLKWMIVEPPIRNDVVSKQYFWFRKVRFDYKVSFLVPADLIEKTFWKNFSGLTFSDINTINTHSSIAFECQFWLKKLGIDSFRKI